MSKVKYIKLFLVIPLFCASVSAYSQGADRAPDTLARSIDLSKWSVNISYDHSVRDLVVKGDGITSFHQETVFARLSYDVMSWATVGFGAGNTWMRFNETDDAENEGSSWTINAKFNLWEYDLVKPTQLESLISLTAAISYWDHEAMYLMSDYEWSEWRLALMLSAEVLLDHINREEMNPYSIKYYAGPYYSNIGPGRKFTNPGAESASGGLDQNKDYGILAGIDLYITPSFAVGWQGRYMDEASNIASISLHF